MNYCGWVLFHASQKAVLMVGGSWFSVCCSLISVWCIWFSSMLMLRFSVRVRVGLSLSASLVAVSCRSLVAVRWFAGLGLL